MRIQWKIFVMNIETIMQQILMVLKKIHYVIYSFFFFSFFLDLYEKYYPDMFLMAFVRYTLLLDSTGLKYYEHCFTCVLPVDIFTL